jgi:hypothetical protein
VFQLFSDILNTKVGSTLTKSGTLRITLNIDGTPITSRTHTVWDNSRTRRWKGSLWRNSGGVRLTDGLGDESLSLSPVDREVVHSLFRVCHFFDMIPLSSVVRFRNQTGTNTFSNTFSITDGLSTRRVIFCMEGRVNFF